MSSAMEDTLAGAFEAHASISSIVPNSQSIPRTLARSYSIAGQPTDLWLQIFRDRVVIGISQLEGRIGNWLLCENQPNLVDPKTLDFLVTHLLGSQRNTPVLDVLARQICEKLLRQCEDPNTAPVVLLGVSLKPETEKDFARLRVIVQLVVQLHGEAMQSSTEAM